uniref:helix-turn-helix transcriptional regulator n=1 Tax=Halosegnis longus TaxID=2216012 RepID=UPI00096A85B7|nr:MULTISPECIES: zinc ribbon domain-containing protein [Halobacteriales]
MYQSDLGDMLGWSATKTSAAATELSEAGRIKKIRLGTENILVLPDETVPEADDSDSATDTGETSVYDPSATSAESESVETNVYSVDDAETATPDTEESSETPEFCTNCGADVQAYTEPTFCPECGSSLGPDD